MVPNKYAVVLVVKNETTDILSWLAWYSVIGFHTFIVFDDNSDDGTWEQLQRASNFQDIRLSRTIGPLNVSYQTRQTESYKLALTKYRDEFEWMAFFDADEYLFINGNKTLASFFDELSSADAIGVNWCNYGSSGHLLKPDLLPIEAYTWHGNAKQPINRHIKSIVRPCKVGPQWINVHCFDVDQSRFLLANGKPVHWGTTPGIIDSDPDWSIAKLMHYQCRSMEHFIERMKKRPNLATIPGIWSVYDIKHEQDVNPLRLASAVRTQMTIYAGDIPKAERAVPVSRDKPARQSSHCRWSIGATLEEDAAGAVNGKIDGTRKFHTDVELNPWWQVDLGQLVEISEVRIYNTTDHTAERFRNFVLTASADSENWVELTRKEDGAVVGTDGKPFIWQDDTGARGRLVRVTLLANNFLHLDQVEVYGAPVLVNEATATGFDAEAVADFEMLIKNTTLSNNLIYDIGMSEGNDTAFYLAKGFRVVGVEADVQVYFSLCERFAEPIRNGKLTLYNMAAAERDGDIVEFFHHDLYQGLSGLSHGRAEFQEGNFTSYFVATVNWPALMTKHGVPHYLKIDIEGHEGPFLQSMAGAGAMPEYISVECHNLSPVEKLHALGYRKFKLIDQQPAGGFRLPAHQCEGAKIEWPKFDHASGPFGQELPEGPWLDFEDFKQAYAAAQALHLPTWYDCHAWMPKS